MSRSKNLKQQQARAVAAVWAIAIFAALLIMMMMSRNSNSQVSAFTTTTISRSRSNKAAAAKNNIYARSVLSMSTATATATANTMLPEGLVKTIVNKGDNLYAAGSIERGDIVTVKYTCYSVSDDSTTKSHNVLLARSDKQKTVRCRLRLFKKINKIKEVMLWVGLRTTPEYLSLDQACLHLR